MSWKFPKLDKPTIFVASPGDVKSYRQTALDEISTLQQTLPDSEIIDFFDWSIDKSQNGFDDWLPAQGQIPLPSDPNCSAVICILGERIGTPLPKEFPINAVASHIREFEPGEYNLKVPWKEGSEHNLSFPLTGTVFEFLASVPANNEARDGLPPVLIKDEKLFPRVQFGEHVKAKSKKAIGFIREEDDGKYLYIRPDGLYAEFESDEGKIVKGCIISLINRGYGKKPKNDFTRPTKQEGFGQKGKKNARPRCWVLYLNNDYKPEKR